MREDALIQWLLDGDPAIRWQVHRDLLGEGRREVNAERARVAREGWGRRILDRQAANGRWMATRGPKGAKFRGLYIPKWTSTTYTMLLLARLGLPEDNPQARRGCRALVEGAEWFPSGGLGFFSTRRTAEHCVSAMVLTILHAFRAEDSARARLERFLLGAQLPDGGWNCVEGATHGSFNTTTAVLEALLPRSRSRQVAHALALGREFLLVHRLYRSHRTGRIVKASFTRLRWPVGWETDVLRELQLFVAAKADRDPRLSEVIDRILRHRRADGRWTCARPQPGALHFAFERAGEPSRWVTLQCLRIVRWWDHSAAR